MNLLNLQKIEALPQDFSFASLFSIFCKANK